MEKTDISDESGVKTGKVMLTKEAHLQGLWHKSVHIWFINSKGELLLKKRSSKKKNCRNSCDKEISGRIKSNNL